MDRLLLATLVTSLCATLGISTGCSTRRTSTTARTAIEEMLISTAVDKAMLKLNLAIPKGSKVLIDFSNFKATDAEYLKVALRAKVARDGMTLVDDAKDADYVMEVASGALAMEDKSSLIGMPALPVPQSPVPSPEVPLFKTIEQTAIVKLLVFVQQKGKFVACDRYYAKADRDESFLMWYRFQREDDVRKGWERADTELTAKAADQVTNKQQEKKK